MLFMDSPLTEVSFLSIYNSETSQRYLITRTMVSKALKFPIFQGFVSLAITSLVSPSCVSQAVQVWTKSESSHPGRGLVLKLGRGCWPERYSGFWEIHGVECWNQSLY